MGENWIFLEEKALSVLNIPVIYDCAKNWKKRAIPKKNAELTDGRTDRQTDRQTDEQTDNKNFIGPSVGWGFNKKETERVLTPDQNWNSRFQELLAY